MCTPFWLLLGQSTVLYSLLKIASDRAKWSNYMYTVIYRVLKVWTQHRYNFVLVPRHCFPGNKCAQPFSKMRKNISTHPLRLPNRPILSTTFRKVLHIFCTKLMEKFNLWTFGEAQPQYVIALMQRKSSVTELLPSLDRNECLLSVYSKWSHIDTFVTIGFEGYRTG